MPFSVEVIWEFDSQEQCAAATGIPLSVLQEAKKNGCPAFKHGRVKLAPLLKWLFKQTGEIQNHGEELKKWKAHLAKTNAEKAAKLVTSNEFIAGALLKNGQAETTILRQRLENEMPSVLEGLEKAQIRIKLKAVADEIIKEFQAMEIHWRQHIEK